MVPTITLPKFKLLGLTFKRYDGWIGPVPATVTIADAVFVLSATLVTITEYVPALVAVYKPEVDTRPPEADQVTAALLVPATVAMNCWVAPAWRDTVVGLIDTLMFRAGVLDRNAVTPTTRPEFPAVTTEHPVQTIPKEETRSTRAKYLSRKIRIKTVVSVARYWSVLYSGGKLFPKITEVAVYTAELQRSINF